MQFIAQLEFELDYLSSTYKRLEVADCKGRPLKLMA
jgi:hypothetical protein